MSSFRLTKKTISRLKAKFEEFQLSRRIIHRNIQDYVRDYKNFQGSPDDRREFLEGEYVPRAPDITHLVFTGENILWNIEDIALILGRDSSSISRLFGRIEQRPGLCVRLLALRHDAKSANNVPINAYDEEIFDLIVDEYEQEYLERFTRPRRGEKSSYADEVLRFWESMKAESYASPLALFDDNDDDDDELYDFPGMRWADVFALMFRRALTPGILVVFPLVFAVMFELARRWSVLVGVFAGASAAVLVVCAVMLRQRKNRAAVFANVGAVAMMSALLWGVGLVSDGTIYTPGGGALTLKDDVHKITLVPQLWENHTLAFRVNSENYDDMKEIFYRTDKNSQYKSTGFNFNNYPDLLIEPGIVSGEINIDVKYTDVSGKEHGAFSFTFNVEDERMRLSKEYIVYNSWLYVTRWAGDTAIHFSVSSNYADNVVGCVVYGINTEKPDKLFFPRGDEDIILRRDYDSIEFVSSYVVFVDGTSSDIKITK